jgi:transcriptional regulator with XRE-family HTH domain
MKTLDQIVKKLPAERRAKIAARAGALIGEEIALRHLRKAQRLTQERMAQLLGIGQDSVSRLESRSDLLLSTLKSYVEAMGGSLKLVVEFPDSVAVLSSLGEAGDAKKPPAPKQKASRGRVPLAHAND